MPETEIASFAVRVSGAHVDALRDFDIPVVARGAEGATWLDLRTVDPLDDEILIRAIRTALAVPAA